MVNNKHKLGYLTKNFGDLPDCNVTFAKDEPVRKTGKQTRRARVRTAKQPPKRKSTVVPLPRPMHGFANLARFATQYFIVRIYYKFTKREKIRYSY